MRFLCALIVSLFSASSFATATCVGNVQTLAIGPQSGWLQVSIGYGVQYLCGISQTYNGVDPQNCRAWYAMFLTAKSTGKKVLMNFDTNVPCNQIGNWSVPNPIPYWAEIVD